MENGFSFFLIFDALRRLAGKSRAKLNLCRAPAGTPDEAVAHGACPGQKVFLPTLPFAIYPLPFACCLLPVAFFRLPFDFDIVFVSVFFAKHLLPLVVVFLRFMFVFASFILYFVLIVVVVG